MSESETNLIRRHPEQSRGIPESNRLVTPRDSSTPKAFGARNDELQR